MLVQLILERPQVVFRILAGTPGWVWALLAALLTLGATQLRDRRAGLVRVSAMPLVMTAFSLWGVASALGNAPLLPLALGAWLAAAVLLVLLLAPGRPTATYDPATRSYALPGSVVPLLLIAGIFLLKYAVGVELHLAPQRLHDTAFMLGVTGLYGGLSGIFLGRAARLWRLALQARAVPAIA